ncbi:DUF2269 family protein [Actinoalloteichus hymeniacidonis]|uniref:DUF2269 family protein n=1 Tax=Actinoalloteichus hymeniacidonis TaxID=340345 RepID=UPI000853B30A|nr:DUF2269 family protein [Actinoalloteichus hymeniacidonis]MBB5907673.1 hypothetical protein [Actinoalloteichus hymeniacidonis]
MTKFLLSVHVIAAIIAIGPVAVAASMFPVAARTALSSPGDNRAVAVLRTLHRICRVYAVVGVVVPVFGIATAVSLGVLTDAWLIVSMTLTAIAAALLIMVLLPIQDTLLTQVGVEPPSAAADTTTALTRRLAMTTGMFNLLWATVTVLMIVRPGSTTGV